MMAVERRSAQPVELIRNSVTERRFASSLRVEVSVRDLDWRIVAQRADRVACFPVYHAVRLIV